MCGTYVHGLFDHPALRTAFLNRLRAGLGLPTRESVVSGSTTSTAWPTTSSAHLDVELLERIVGLESMGARPADH